MMMKFHEARISCAPSVTCWGTGTPLREFLHVDDLGRALLMMLEDYSGELPVNIGSGEELTIRELAAVIAETTDYRGAIDFDPAKPDGVPRKMLDSARIRSMGWVPAVSLRDGLRDTYKAYLQQQGYAGAA